MSEFEGFEERSSTCAVCETMLPEAVDGTLSETEQTAFDKHVAGCPECARELADARRGAAWLGMLKSKAPEPPAGLLAKILSGTTGAVEADITVPSISVPSISVPSISVPSISVPSIPLPAPAAPGILATPIASLPTAAMHSNGAAVSPLQGWGRRWIALRRQMGDVFSIESARTTFQPRLAMTAAMAFFSIALTLNLTGVRLRDLRASNFTPSAVMRTVADAEASATRLFQNNRAVYQVESRLSELRSDDAPDSASPVAHR